MINQRIKHFSHNDADGAGAIVVSKRVFAHVDHVMCSYENINEQVEKFLEDYMSDCDSERYDIVLITDISLNEIVAELFDRTSTLCPETKFLLIDHHEKVNWLNKYLWSNVTGSQSDSHGVVKKAAGTSLWCNHLISIGYVPDDILNEMQLFSETIRQWDTWDWTLNGNKRASEINSLLYIIGKESFVQRFTNDLSIDLTDVESILLETEELRTKLYIDEKKREIKRYKTPTGLTVGVVFAEQHISILGNEICKTTPDIDFIIMLTPSKGRASMRTVRRDLDMGTIAQIYGGGGHPQTAGCPIDNLLKYAVELGRI